MHACMHAYIYTNFQSTRSYKSCRGFCNSWGEIDFSTHSLTGTFVLKNVCTSNASKFGFTTAKPQLIW